MGCTGEPELIPFQGKNKCEIYRRCGGEAQVGYCSLEGGHVLYQQTALNIADYAWKFFDQFSLPLPDADSDGIGDKDDNCAHVANPDQADANVNCIGDACECETSASCDDKLFCNGSEVCTTGMCELGTPPCTLGQTCDESARRCVDVAAKPEASAAGSGGAVGAQTGGAGATPSGAAVGGTLSAAVQGLAGASGVNGSGAPAANSAVADVSSSMDPPAPEARSGCACHAVGNAGPRHAVLLWLGVALLVARLRRRLR
jgi:MYXO-CTERM domain-containing protein